MPVSAGGVSSAWAGDGSVWGGCVPAPRGRYQNALRYRFPVGPLVSRVNHDLVELARAERPDVVWFDKPVEFTPETVRAVKALGATTVCYNQDNPFGPRNDGCWMQFYRVYKLFDLHCLFRTVDVEAVPELGVCDI